MSTSKKKPMPALAPLDTAAFSAAAVAIPDPVSAAMSSAATPAPTRAAPIVTEDAPLSKVDTVLENVRVEHDLQLRHRGGAAAHGNSNGNGATQPSRAGKVQLSVWVRAEKRQQLKRRALDLGRPVDEIVNELIDGFLRF